jgi:predicted transcriptional regulator
MPAERDTDRDRVTVTLAPGQKDRLKAIADLNATTVAFLVRHAVAQFFASAEDPQLKLQFPPES